MSDGSMNPALFLDLEIVNELGLHARSAAQIVKLAQKAGSGVWLEKDEERVDAKQVVDILTLAAGKGDQVRVCIDDIRDRDILDNIARLIRDGFRE